MLTLFKKVLRLVIPKQKVWEIKNRQNIPSMEWSLMNIKKLGFYPDFVIDVGAYDGEWTQMIKVIFPSAKVLMIEAQQDKEIALKAVTQKSPGTYFHIDLLGAESGKQVTFNVNSTVSSVLEEYKPNNFKKDLRGLQTLDNIIENYSKLGFPDFIKLDVQGYELEVLKGFSENLTHVQFVLCEVSLIEINKGCPLISDVIRFMDDIGFITYDICSFIRRPLDRALWQTDILFIKKTHLLNQNKYWD